jgi:hypothetical protein
MKLNLTESSSLEVQRGGKMITNGELVHISEVVMTVL